MAATGLSADPEEYRKRLAEQSDEQIDAWAAELMRDVAKRRGVIRVLTDLRKAAKLSEADIERVFASGGGPPAVIGRESREVGSPRKSNVQSFAFGGMSA